MHEKNLQFSFDYTSISDWKTIGFDAWWPADVTQTENLFYDITIFVADLNKIQSLKPNQNKSTVQLPGLFVSSDPVDSSTLSFTGWNSYNGCNVVFSLVNHRRATTVKWRSFC